MVARPGTASSAVRPRGANGESEACWHWRAGRRRPEHPVMGASAPDLGLAILAVAVCLALGGGVALGATFLWVVGNQRRGAGGDVAAASVRGCLFPIALLAMPIAASVGAWLVVGAPGDWGRFLRAVGGAGALYLVFVLAYGALTEVSWRLGVQRPAWGVAVVGIAAALGVVAFVLVAAVLPEPFAVAFVALTVVVTVGVLWLVLAGGI